MATILSPAFQPANLRHRLVESPGTWRYAKLRRLKVPVLVVHSLDGSESSRRDVHYLRSTVPAVESAAVDRGGPWASWLGRTVIASRLPAFKTAAEKAFGAVPRGRTRTLNGQPLGWMIALFTLLAAGLTLGSGWLRFQPDYMGRVIPPLLSGLLPILWFVVPREINPFVFLRFRRLSVRNVALPLLVGALLAVFYRSLLLTLVRVYLPVHPPRSVLSISPGGSGRLLELAGIAVVALFVFGVAGNLLVMRRSGLQVLLPALLFTLLPPGFPDVLWKLPMGFAAAVLFAAGVSIYAPLFMLAAFAAVCELAVPIDRLPIYWQSAQGVAATVAVLAAAILLAVTVGTRGRPIAPEQVYFSGTIRADSGPFRWRGSLGIVLVFCSLVGSVGFVFYFLDFR